MNISSISVVFMIVVFVNRSRLFHDLKTISCCGSKRVETLYHELYRSPSDKHGNYLGCFTEAGQSFGSIIRGDSSQLHAARSSYFLFISKDFCIGSLEEIYSGLESSLWLGSEMSPHTMLHMQGNCSQAFHR